MAEVTVFHAISYAKSAATRLQCNIVSTTQLKLSNNNTHKYVMAINYKSSFFRRRRAALLTFVCAHSHALTAAGAWGINAVCSLFV